MSLDPYLLCGPKFCPTNIVIFRYINPCPLLPLHLDIQTTTINLIMPTTKSVLLGLLLTASTAYSIPQPIPRATARVDAKLAQTAATLPEGGIISFSVQLKDLPAVDVPKGMNDRDEVGKFVYEVG